MAADFVLALDQGTTSSRAIVFDRDGRMVAVAQREYPQGYPALGHVTHDPEDIWDSQLGVAREVLETVPGGVAAIAALEKGGVNPALVIDASHANCSKDFRRMPGVFEEIVAQRAAGNRHVVGAMLESNLAEGSQGILDDHKAMTWGQSVTDPCIGWETTERVLREAAERHPIQAAAPELPPGLEQALHASGYGGGGD